MAVPAITKHFGGVIGRGIAAGVGRYVSFRRHLARNYPYLWQIRLHALLLVFVGLALVSVGAGLTVPVDRYYFLDFEAAHKIIFLLSLLGVIYWLISYLLLLDPSQNPPTRREPSAAVLIVCSLALLVPSYAFLYVAKGRVAAAFPSVAEETLVVEFFEMLERKGGDRFGVFRPLVLKDEMPNTAESESNNQYVIEDETIGPASLKGARTLAFRREVVCDLADRMLRKYALPRQVQLQPAGSGPVQPSPTPGSDHGEKGWLGPIDIAERSVAPPHIRALNDLSSGLVSAMTYTLSTQGASERHRYCVSVRGKKGCANPKMEISIVCDAISPGTVDQIFARVTDAVKVLWFAYIEPASPAELSVVSNTLLVPFCEVLQKTAKCRAADHTVRDIIGPISSSMWNSRLALIKKSHGAYEEITSLDANIPNEPGSGGLRSAEFVATREIFVHDERVSTLGKGWLLAWFFGLAVLAISIKSFRLVREASTNYLLAALVLVPGCVLLAWAGVDAVRSAINSMLDYFGWQPIELKLDPDVILSALFGLSLGYVVWQLSRRRCSPWTRVMASFNLFFVIVAAFYLPFIEFPLVGSVFSDRKPSLIGLPVFALYFGVLYDACYLLARTARERPT